MPEEQQSLGELQEADTFRKLHCIARAMKQSNQMTRGTPAHPLNQSDTMVVTKSTPFQAFNAVNFLRQKIIFGLVLVKSEYD